MSIHHDCPVRTWSSG